MKALRGREVTDALQKAKRKSNICQVSLDNAQMNNYWQLQNQ